MLDYITWVILIWIFTISLLTIAILFFIFYYKTSRGKGRKIIGEITRDLGLALMIGGTFKYNVLESSFYIVLLIGAFLLIIGVLMKEDNK